MYERYDPLSKQSNAEAEQKEAAERFLEQAVARDKALIEQALVAAHESLEGLGKEVDGLLERIRPVCQPASISAGVAKAQPTEATEARPSPLRNHLIKLRAQADAISSRISSVRYTIEI